MLDPTATLAINDWLINLRAAAGTEFKLLFMTRPQLVENFRIEEGKPYTTYPDFDSIAGVRQPRGRQQGARLRGVAGRA